MDNLYEDVELEVATAYSQRLGLPSDFISELFNSIATIEEKSPNLQSEIQEFMKLHNF